jgi:hypothetical protein
MSKHVAIVIVNWNGRQLLETCLPAALAQTYPDVEIIVVDNGSSDGSAEWLAANYPQARLLRNMQNMGFAAANNQAFAASTAPFLALLNSDAAPEPGWLAAMVQAMESDASVGACAPQIRRWDDHGIVDSLGLSIDRSGTAREWQSGQRAAPADAADVRDVFGASGAACLLRRAMLDDIGAFDEDFFAYLEDADLAWRARLAGWRCLYAPAAIVYHRHSASSGEGSPFKGYHLGRNKCWMIVKNYPWPDLLVNMPLILGRELLAVAYHLFVRRDVHPLRGRLAAWRGLRRALLQRRAIQQRATAAGRRAARELRHPLHVCE